MKVLPYFDEYFLQQIIGIIVRQHHFTNVPINTRLILTDDQFERFAPGGFLGQQVNYLRIRRGISFHSPQIVFNDFDNE
jgi:hypothetical protein